MSLSANNIGTYKLPHCTILVGLYVSLKRQTNIIASKLKTKKTDNTYLGQSMWLYILIILLFVFIYHFIDEIKHFMYSLHLMAQEFNSSYIDDDDQDNEVKSEEEQDNKIKSN